MTCPPGSGYWDRPLNAGERALVDEELAEDALRDLFMDWAEPTDWELVRWEA